MDIAPISGPQTTTPFMAPLGPRTPGFGPNAGANFRGQLGLDVGDAARTGPTNANGAGPSSAPGGPSNGTTGANGTTGPTGGSDPNAPPGGIFGPQFGPDATDQGTGSQGNGATPANSLAARFGIPGLGPKLGLNFDLTLSPNLGPDLAASLIPDLGPKFGPDLTPNLAPDLAQQLGPHFGPDFGQNNSDRFGPAIQIGPSGPPKTVFVVYTQRGTFSAPVAPAEPPPPPPEVTPHGTTGTGLPGSSQSQGPLTVADLVTPLANPIQRPPQTRISGVNVPFQVLYNYQGQAIRQVTLFFGGGASNQFSVHYRVIV
jgi:hypothetical protein